MKTKLVKALVLMLLVSTVFFAVSCKNNGKESQSQSIVQSESVIESNTEESVSVHVCDYTELKYNATHHWYECSCGEKDNATEQAHVGGEATCQELAECTTCGQSYGSYGAHNMVDGACSICGKEESQGLEYELSSDGTYYVVIGIGTCTDTDLVIPLAYNTNVSQHMK